MSRLSEYRLRLKINKTISYSNFFNFPLHRHEIFFWLITQKKVKYKSLYPFLPKNISERDLNKRYSLKMISEMKVVEAKKILKLFSIFPSIQFVGITGSVAVKNARCSDDIDLFIVASKNTLWITRPIIISILQMFFKVRRFGHDLGKVSNKFCLNLWFDEADLVVPKSKRSLYSAHEVLQILPILDRNNLYLRLLKANKWISKHLANAYFLKIKKVKSRKEINSFASSFCWPLNMFFYFCQRIYMYRHHTVEMVTYRQAYFHLIDYQTKIKQYIGESKKVY